MYPTTKFNIVDNSAIPSLPIEDNSIYKVLEMIGFSSDQGPESYKIVEGDEFFKLYGKSINFEKHGQPLLQAAVAINAGARLYCKRIVAEDAALANVGIVAVIEQGKDETELCLHYQTVTVNNASGDKYENNFKNFGVPIKEDFNIAVASTYLGDPNAKFDSDYYASKIKVEDGKVKVTGPVYFPLFVIADNGRGVSSKNFKIIPDIAGSKYYQFIKYQFEINQNNNNLETINFALDPSTSYEGANLSIETAFRKSAQMTAKQNADIILEFINAIATILNISKEELARHDILTLRDNKKKALAVNKATDNGIAKFTYVDASNIAEYTFKKPGEVTATSTSAAVSTQDFPVGETTVTFNSTNHTGVSSLAIAITATKSGTTYAKTVTLSDSNSWTDTLASVDLTGMDSDQLTLVYTATVTEGNKVYTKTETLATSEITKDVDLTDVTSWSPVSTEEDTEDTTTNASFKETTITEIVAMGGGDNGSFGSKPIASESYNRRMLRVFGPDTELKKPAYDSEIYDIDNIKIDVIVDANYSHGVEDQEDPTTRHCDIKTAIQNFVNFREDCLYFADMGTNIRTFNEIVSEEAKFINDKFTAIYHNSYNIVDPYSYKEITVTIGYSIATLLVNHFAAGRNRPFAGILFGNTIGEAIDGTLNYVPARVLGADGSEINEKEQLDDLRVNYASYYDGVLTIETEYTCQENYTQFSFLNNILLIQKLIKDIRSKCPKIRYTFMNGDDLTYYKEEVEKVIDAEAPNYLDIQFTYYDDETYVQNKIFYGGIEVKFRNFVQSEIFKITAVG